MSIVLVDYSRTFYTDDQLITEVENIEFKLDGNPDFLTPSPTVTIIIGLRKSFEAALAKSIHGTPTDTSDKNYKRMDLEKSLHTLGAYVQLTSSGNETKILSTGMYTASTKSNIGAFDVVNNFKVITHEASNKVICSCDKMPKAGFYEVLYTPSPVTDTSVWISETSTRCTIEIDNLPSYIPYVFKMAARGSSKIKNFSNQITKAAG